MLRKKPFSAAFASSPGTPIPNPTHVISSSIKPPEGNALADEAARLLNNQGEFHCHGNLERRQSEYVDHISQPLES